MDKDISKYIYDKTIDKIRNLTFEENKIDYYYGFFENVADGFYRALVNFGVKCSVLIGNGGSFDLGDRFKFFVNFNDGYQLTLFYFIINNNILTIEIGNENYAFSSTNGLESFVSEKCLSKDILKILVDANHAGLTSIL